MTEAQKGRLKAFFSDPALSWILERLVARMSSGRPLTGKLVRDGATAEERRAVDDLIGRPGTAGTRLSLDLEVLQETLRGAALAQNLEEVVLACHGKVENRQAESERLREAWEAAFKNAKELCKESPALLAWIETLSADGTLKRLSKGDLRLAAGLLNCAARIMTRDSGAELLLANLAAQFTGNSHALDRGEPLATLCLRAISVLNNIDGQQNADARRRAWESVGVVIDDLSAPVLTFNLRGAPGSALENILGPHRWQRQPAFITYRQLKKERAFEPLAQEMQVVFICENPSVVSEAARELGPDCHPFICTNGQPASAAHLLLNQLRQAGAELRAHADFDWAGLRIVDQLVREHGAIPWRMNAAEYLNAQSATVSLESQIFSAEWCAELSDVLRHECKAVFEEQIMQTLLHDLASSRESARRRE